MSNIVKMLDVSTIHISEKTANWIDNQVQENNFIIYPKSEYGWFLPCDLFLEEREKMIPSDLLIVLEYAFSNGCTWVMFDRDGLNNSNLPIYDWR